MEKEILNLKYNIVLKRVERLTGKILDELKVHNLVTTVGKEQVNDFLAGNVVTEPTHIAIGEGTTSPTVGDTALENESLRQSATVSEPSSVSTEYTTTFSPGSGQSFAITELGLFNSGAGGDMFNRATFTARNINDAIDLIATVTVTVS